MKHLLLLLTTLLLTIAASAQDTTATESYEEQYTIYRFDIKEDIGPPVARTTNLAMDEAHELGVDLIVIHMNTYGGLVDAADEIRTRILRSEIPVYVWIENNAASAGALISLACDSIYMMPGATIGAATVVDQEGNQVPDKYQSYMRKKMRATAEENNRDPEIAEAMVDPDKVVPGVSEAGKVVTFTVGEAIANGFCEAEVTSIEAIYKRSRIIEYEEIVYQEDWVEDAIKWLINPAVSGILITIIFLGIYFELQSPGMGFPALAALTATVLYFAPHYLEGLAESWEVILFIVGLILIALEVFVIPGFGVAGVLGIGCTLSGLTLALVGNVGFDFAPVNVDAMVTASFIVIVSTLTSVTGGVFLGVKFFNSNLFKFAVLESSQQKEDGYVSTDQGLNALIGTTGAAFTMLRPSGKVEIDGKIYDATAETSFIEKGEAVTVIDVRSAQIFVAKA